MKAIFKKYKIAFVVCLIIMLGTAVFCGIKVIKEMKRETTIGICMPNKIQKRWEQDAKSLVEKLEAKNYKTILEFGDDNVYKQRDQIEEMIKKKVDVLLITPIQDDSIADLVEKAKEEGIYVIAYDRMITNSDLVDFYITFENYSVGRLQAEFIVEKLGLVDKNNTNVYNVEIFAGDPVDYNSEYYYKGAMAVLKKYLDDGQIVIPSGQILFDDCSTEKWSANIAANRLNTLLDKCYQDKPLHAVLCANDGLSVGVYERLVQKGYADKMPILTGQDAEIAYMKLVKDSDIMMTVFKDTRILAEETVMMIDDVMNGRIPKINNTTDYNNGKKRVNSYESEVVRVDRSNYVELLIDSGYISTESLQ